MFQLKWGFLGHLTTYQDCNMIDHHFDMEDYERGMKYGKSLHSYVPLLVKYGHVIPDYHVNQQIENEK